MRPQILVLGHRAQYLAAELMRHANVDAIPLIEPIRTGEVCSVKKLVIRESIIPIFKISEPLPELSYVKPNRTYDAPGKSAHKKGKR